MIERGLSSTCTVVAKGWTKLFLLVSLLIEVAFVDAEREDAIAGATIVPALFCVCSFLHISFFQLLNTLSITY